MDKLNKSDILKILTLIRANYENAYANTSDEEAALLVSFWYESLESYPRSIVFEATKNAIRNSEFAPKLANILNEVKRLTNVDKPTDIELWAQLTNVLDKVYDLSRYLRYPQYYKWASDKIDEIYKSLPDDIKLFVVNTSTLIEISELSPENLAFEKARFFKHMPLLRKHLEDKLAAEQFLALSDKKTGTKLINNKK